MATGTSNNKKKIKLPPPSLAEPMPIVTALANRRSHETFAPEPLTVEDVSELCWAGQGVTGKPGRRAAPSAREMYPISMFLADATGVLEYRPKPHQLVQTLDGDLRAELCRIALGKAAVADAPAVFIFTINPRRMEMEFEHWALRLCYIEVGAIAENMLLQATAMDLVGIPIGAFEPDPVRAALQLGSRQQPALMLPIGRPVAT
jgi:SagB-type dehydrogenase family enzyme